MALSWAVIRVLWDMPIDGKPLRGGPKIKIRKIPQKLCISILRNRQPKLRILYLECLRLEVLSILEFGGFCLVLFPFSADFGMYTYTYTWYHSFIHERKKSLLSHQHFTHLPEDRFTQYWLVHLSSDSDLSHEAVWDSPPPAISLILKS